MFSCDYNGWADVREEEREALDAFEPTNWVPSAQLNVPVVFRRQSPPNYTVPRQAA
ncbi:MAG TPA: hypothetical protein VFZ87_13530 [Gemmatimonadales bacterium]